MTILLIGIKRIIHYLEIQQTATKIILFVGVLQKYHGSIIENLTDRRMKIISLPAGAPQAFWKWGIILGQVRAEASGASYSPAPGSILQGNFYTLNIVLPPTPYSFPFIVNSFQVFLFFFLTIATSFSTVASSLRTVEGAQLNTIKIFKEKLGRSVQFVHPWKIISFDFTSFHFFLRSFYYFFSFTSFPLNFSFSFF